MNVNINEFEEFNAEDLKLTAKDWCKKYNASNQDFAFEFSSAIVRILGRDRYANIRKIQSCSLGETISDIIDKTLTKSITIKAALAMAVAQYIYEETYYDVLFQLNKQIAAEGIKQD